MQVLGWIFLLSVLIIGQVARADYPFDSYNQNNQMQLAPIDYLKQRRQPMNTCHPAIVYNAFSKQYENRVVCN